MGVYIPNMRMPKSCDDCTFEGEDWGCVIIPDAWWLRTMEEVYKHCPLTEIVTCSECKHLEVINGAKIYAHCPMWGIDFIPFEDDTRTNYCSWGERRAE